MLWNSDIVPNTKGFNFGVNCNSTITRFRRFAEIDVLEVLLGQFSSETTFQVVILIDLGFIQANNIKLK